MSFRAPRKVLLSLATIAFIALLARFTISADVKSTKQIDLLAVENKWMLPIATAVVAKLEDNQKRPILMMLPQKAQEGTVALAKKIAGSKCIIFSTRETPEIPSQLPAISLSLGKNPSDASIALAHRFWKRSKIVIVCSPKDSEGVIYGSALAAHMKVPFVFLDKKQHKYSKAKLNKLLTKLSTKQVWVIACAQQKAPRWASSLHRNSKICDREEVERLLLDKIGRDNVRNVVLTRVPAKYRRLSGRYQKLAQTAWIAPYLSLVRRAPIILCNSPKGEQAQDTVMAFLEKHQIKPRSLTILSDYSSIGEINLRIASDIDEFFLSVEPCVLSPDNQANTMSVGRIPCSSLERGAALLARIFARERFLNEPGRVLMIANPASEYGTLPLAETVSRATAEEFKNFSIPIDEFYSCDPEDPNMVIAAEQAQLILYEGHIVDQMLFPSPSYMEEGFSEIVGELGEEIREENFDENYTLVEVPRPKRTLHKFPLVVLQSCSSLEIDVAQDIFDAGGVGMIGTVTSVHSASGSSLLKTVCNGVLYHDYTIGQALREARNYFWCLAQLKAKRNHKETAKVKRVALSFRLWGDPEMRIFLHPLATPKRASANAYIKENQVYIATPAEWAPRCETPQYFTRMFPGSEVAGLVKRIKNQDTRRIMLLYYHKFPIPETFDSNWKNLAQQGDTSNRSAFLFDHYGRSLHVLYFPDKGQQNEEIVLTFSR